MRTMADEATNTAEQAGAAEAAAEGGEVAAPSPTADGPTSPNIDDLKRELAEMEETQTQLASRLDAEQPRLDSRLAVIEEQFRRNFDDRLRGEHRAQPTETNSSDVLLVNRVFREVSRAMGDDWLPVFEALMSTMPPDVLDDARQTVQQHPTLMQGYRSLLAWRQSSGPEFNIRRLVEVLRSCDMDDVADLALSLLDRRDEKEQKTKPTKPVQRRKSDVSTKSRTSVLDNRRMLLLAKKVGGDWEPLGKALGVPEEEMAEIKEAADSSTYQGAFKMLWAWRQSLTSRDEAASHEALREALGQINKAQLINE